MDMIEEKQKLETANKNNEEVQNLSQQKKWNKGANFIIRR